MRSATAARRKTTMILAPLKGCAGAGEPRRLNSSMGHNAARNASRIFAETRLQLRLSPNESIIEAGPVWDNGSWREDAFPL